MTYDVTIWTLRSLPIAGVLIGLVWAWRRK
jgi:hypothetical protein